MPVEITFNVLPEVEKAMRDALGLVITKTALDIVGDAKRSLTGPKAGTVYKRRRKGRHQASAPGEPPATDTGYLAGSIESDTSEAHGLYAEVTVSAEYAELLEMGSPGGQLAARPFLTPAAEGRRPGFEKAAASAVRGAATRVGKEGSP